MHIVIVHRSKIPALQYGGTERVIWDLGKALTEKGHKVSYLIGAGSHCDFATVHFYDPKIDLDAQIPAVADFVHLNFNPPKPISTPYLVTVHGNPAYGEVLDQQSVFISKNHANRYGSSTFVYNGLDWRNYPKVNLESDRKSFHFLANAAWRVKNVKGAINITKKAKEKLEVLGGYRFNFKMGMRFTFDGHVRFRGMVNNWEKSKYMSQSKGLIFPVLWNEPFGLAIIESLYFGCPVFGTPYGSLPEIVGKDYGFLSADEEELINAIKNANRYSSQQCHQYAIDYFSAALMAENYLKLYESVLKGEILNQEQPTLQEENNSKYLPYSPSKNS